MKQFNLMMRTEIEKFFIPFSKSITNNNVNINPVLTINKKKKKCKQIAK